ncbi:MAG: hypothetical protein HN731_03895 [Rhodospirillaceae bacterium]|jgi:hypothetical protein|nr:hypothetical protein [Rhodospirillaceae bacterium]MBT7954306.1 hypothetical protein [Rhodospirillaceae bacterium]
MRTLFLLVGVMIGSAGALAQSKLPTPPPQNSGPAVNTARPAKMLGTFFSDLEKQIIRETLGAVTAATTKTTAKSDNDENEMKQNHQSKGRSKHNKKGKKKGLPPGLAKRDKLPPGLQKQLERNGKLPPGLQKRALPSDLEAKLSPPREGTERVIINQDVVLIEKATNTVLDIIKGVLTK